jgi:hypothetical protein
MNAPNGLNIKVIEKEKADNKDAVKESVLGKNSSLSKTAM